MELSLKSNGGYDYDNLEVEKMLAHLEAGEHITSTSGFEKIDTRSEARLRPSIEEPPVLELK